MSIIIFAILVILLAAAGLSVRYYLISDLSFGARLLMIGLRITLLTLVGLALMEPSLRLSRLSPPDRTVPVLIDVSQSMRLFSPDSSARPLLAALGDAKKTGPWRFPLFLFGDSLRAPPKDHVFRYSDRHSRAPADAEGIVPRSRRALIISDGAWDDAWATEELLDGREIRWLPLPPAAMHSHLAIEAALCADNVPVDSPAIAVVDLRGHLPRPGDCIVTAADRRRIVARRAVHCTAGRLSDTLLLRLPSDKPGRTLYRVSAVFDSLRAQCRVVQNIVPSHLRAALYASAPDLDARFLSIVLHDDSTWHFPAPADSADALFLVRPDANAAEIVRRLRPSAIVVCIGAVPCASPLHSTPTLVRTAPGPGLDFAARMEEYDLPAPQELLHCGDDRHFRDACLVDAITGAGGKSDTLPLLFAAPREGREALYCAARGIWRWDFWPRGVPGADEESWIAGVLIPIVKNQALLRLENGLFLHAASGETFEGDSIPLRMIVPAEVRNAGAGVLHLALSRGNDTLYDSLIAIDLSHGPAPSIFLPPLTSGNYEYRAVLLVKGRESVFADSLEVQTDQSELRVEQQARLMLDQLGRPISTDPQKAVAELTAMDPGERMQTVTRVIHIDRNWWMLLMIFGIWTAEWIARKKLSMD